MTNIGGLELYFARLLIDLAALLIVCLPSEHVTPAIVVILVAALVIDAWKAAIDVFSDQGAILRHC